jgi:outer membrane protein
MNTPLRCFSFVVIALLGALPFRAAEPAVRLAVVDLASLFNQHYKTAEHQAKLQADEEKAHAELGQMVKDGNALVEDYKKLVEQSNNPALSAEAKAKIQAEAQKKLEVIQGKQNELQTFRNNAAAALQQRMQTFRSLMVEEISKLAIDVAHRRGANVLFDKSGPSQFGVPNLLFADAAFDITEDVLKEINKDRPAGTTAPATATKDGSETKVPGIAPKN